MVVPHSEWRVVEKELSSWLRSFSGRNLVFRNPNQAIPGYPTDGFRSDGLLTNNKVLLAIEVEFGQSHPDTNVGKYWLLAEHHQYAKIYLFHVYTPRFNSYGWRKRLGEFYARKMEAELPFQYVQLDQRQATSVASTIEDAKAAMLPIIEREFGNEGS